MKELTQEAPTLRVTLKKKWFDMEQHPDPKFRKDEEYREIKPYWISRFHAWGNAFDECRDFNIVEFRNGYGKKSPSIRLKCEGITIGVGKSEWGANNESYIIKLGKILSIKNYKP